MKICTNKKSYNQVLWRIGQILNFLFLGPSLHFLIWPRSAALSSTPQQLTHRLQTKTKADFFLMLMSHLMCSMFKSIFAITSEKLRCSYMFIKTIIVIYGSSLYLNSIHWVIRQRQKGHFYIVIAFWSNSEDFISRELWNFEMFFLKKVLEKEQRNLTLYGIGLNWNIGRALNNSATGLEPGIFHLYFLWTHLWNDSLVSSSEFHLILMFLILILQKVNGLWFNSKYGLNSTSTK